jgi:hypothetical protein
VKRPILVVTLVVGISISAGCRSNARVDASKFTVETVQGIRHIINHAPQIEGAAPVRFELIGTIGRLEGREEKDILYDPVDVARHPNGDILVLEGDGCKVKRFDEHHQLVSSFGQKGLGPGDLVSPYRLRLNAEKDMVYIAADNRVSWFSLNGRFIGSFKCATIRPGGGSISREYRTSGMSLLSDAQVVLPSDHSVWEERGQAALLTVYDAAGTALRHFAAVTRFDDPLMTLNANIIYFATDANDACFVVYAHQNRIEGYSRGGRLLFSSERPLPYAIKNEMRDEVFTSGAVKRVFAWPSVTSVAKGVSIDKKGLIWVLTFLAQPNRFGGFDAQDDLSRCYRFDVFDQQGVLQFTVAPPNVVFGGFTICDDRMYLIDSGHESCVHEYRIVDKN